MAIDMQNAVQGLIAEWCALGYNIGFGIGLAAGRATVGRIGYKNRAEYTAIGSVVNLASRLCNLARDHQILVDPTAFTLLDGQIDLVSLGAHSIRGYDKEILVYKLECEKARLATTKTKPDPIMSPIGATQQ
jgi:class 3 adenylate cyclase